MTDSNRPDGDTLPFPTRDHHPTSGTDKKPERPVTEETLDEAIEESFPASDPVSVGTRKSQDAR